MPVCLRVFNLALSFERDAFPVFAVEPVEKEKRREGGRRVGGGREGGREGGGREREREREREEGVRMMWKRER